MLSTWHNVAPRAGRHGSAPGSRQVAPGAQRQPGIRLRSAPPYIPARDVSAWSCFLPESA
jgi:hypothetical protein